MTEAWLKHYGIKYTRLGWENYPGWNCLIMQCLLKMKAAGWSGDLAQVKMKFGQLRLYYYHIDDPCDYDKLNQLVAECEKACSETCPWCGVAVSEKDYKDRKCHLCNMRVGPY